MDGSESITTSLQKVQSANSRNRRNLQNNWPGLFNKYYIFKLYCKWHNYIWSIVPPHWTLFWAEFSAYKFWSGKLHVEVCWKDTSEELRKVGLNSGEDDPSEVSAAASVIQWEVRKQGWPFRIVPNWGKGAWFCIPASTRHLIWAALSQGLHISERQFIAP